jgi:putative transposase
MTQRSPFRYFKTSPEIIRLAVMLYVRFPLSLRNVEDLLHERGIEISHETVRYWWNRFGPMFAAELRRTGAGSAVVQTSANATEVRVRPCLGPQSLSDGAPPPKP